MSEYAEEVGRLIRRATRPVVLHSSHVVDYTNAFEDQVLVLAREMHAESVSHRDMPMNEAKLLTQLRAASSMPDTVYFRVCVLGSTVLGGFFGTIATAYFTDERVAKDLAWFVTRQRRGTRAALLLVRDFEAWAQSKGIRKFMLGQSTGVAIDTTRALYEHLGYRVVGFNTVKEV